MFDHKVWSKIQEMNLSKDIAGMQETNVLQTQYFQ